MADMTRSHSPYASNMPHWLNRFLRGFTKHVANPLTLSRARRGNHQYAVLHHVGRRSGRSYQTPLAALPVDGGFIIPLVYGDDTDWCRNLVAAGAGRVDVNGEAIAISNPRVVPLTTVEGQVPVAQIRRWTKFGIHYCMRVDRTSPVASPAD